MDLKMSDLDGLEATRRLQADPATAAIPVIAVTASAFGDRRQAARDAGCVDYLAKPVRAEMLFAALQASLASDSSADPTWMSRPARSIGWRPGGGRTLRPASSGGRHRRRDRARRAGARARGADALEAALGRRIARLVANFDFEGLRDLAASLGEGASHRAGD